MKCSVAAFVLSATLFGAVDGTQNENNDLKKQEKTRSLRPGSNGKRILQSGMGVPFQKTVKDFANDESRDNKALRSRNEGESAEGEDQKAATKEKLQAESEKALRSGNSNFDNSWSASMLRGPNSQTVSENDGDKQETATKEKLQAEKGAKALRSDAGEAGPFYMKQKLGTKKAQEENDISNNSQIEVSIVGGDESQVGDFPYYVDMQGCGGTLIAPNVVLSAAHCGSYIGQTVYVSGYEYGTTNYNAVAVKVTKGARHPQYNDNNLRNDFFLHYLEEEVFPDSQITLALNTDGATPADGQDLTVLGLGTLTEGGVTPDILRDVVIPTVSNSFCSSGQSYGNEFDPDVMLCAGEPGRDSCQGDSGGPIVIRDSNNHVLVGVVSWGYGCADANYPGVYARVSSAIDWIQSVACDTWNSNGSFCVGGSNPNPSPTTPAPQPSPTPPTDGSCVELKLEFKTDSWPEETSFSAENVNGIVIEGGSFDAEHVYNFDACVPEDLCTTLSFFDDYGDGLLGDGYLIVTWNDQEIYNGWDLGSGVQWELGNGCGRESQPTPAPVDPTDGNCAVLKMVVRTDDWPDETYFSLANDVDGIVWDVQGNLQPNQEYTYQQSVCIRSDQCTILDVTDTYGDGLIDNGYMVISWGSEVLFNNEDIGFGFTVALGDGCA